MPDELFVETRDALETRVLKVTEEQGALLRSVLEQLQAVDVTGESSTAEQLMAVEQRNLLLEEEAEADAQLAQLGMAIEIINHEFSGTIRSVRNGLRKLKAWADVNEGLRELYDSIRASFDHLGRLPDAVHAVAAAPLQEGGGNPRFRDSGLPGGACSEPVWRVMRYR